MTNDSFFVPTNCPVVVVAIVVCYQFFSLPNAKRDIQSIERHMNESMPIIISIVNLYI